jgi:hypothetical protein
MRLLRGMAGALMWIVSALVGLVGVILCVTVVLFPVGVAVLGVARRMFAASVRLMLPRALAHPAKEVKRSARRGAEDVEKKASRGARKSGKSIDSTRDAVDKRVRKRRGWRRWLQPFG